MNKTKLMLALISLVLSIMSVYELYTFAQKQSCKKVFLYLISQQYGKDAFDSLPKELQSLIMADISSSCKDILK